MNMFAVSIQICTACDVLLLQYRNCNEFLKSLRTHRRNIYGNYSVSLPVHKNYS